MFRAALVSLLILPAVLSAQESKAPLKYAKLKHGQALQGQNVVPTAAEPPKSVMLKFSTYPSQIDFTGPRDEQRLGVLGQFSDGRTWELTRTAKYTSANPKIAEVDSAGIVRPVGEGQTTITVAVNGKNQTIPVKVTNATADIPVSFSREIVPILTRSG